MRLFAGFLAGSALAANPFPRAATDICEIDFVQGESCSDIRTNDPNAESGVYQIQLPNNDPFIVECVFENGFAYTVIQKRTTGNLPFNRNWADYKKGFTSWSVNSIGVASGGKNGSNSGQRGPRPDTCILEEYWIGLDNIYALTNGLSQNNLRIDMQRYTGQTSSIHYDNFVINNERDNYRLVSVGEFVNDASHNVGNSFVGAGFGQQGYSPRDKYNTNHIGMEFSTFDQDHDKYYANCARQDSSGWWFNRCSAANLNGKHYGQGSSAKFTANEHGFDDGILWQTWTNNKYESLVGTKMMLANPVPADDSKSGQPSQLPASSCQEVAEQMEQSGQLNSSTRPGSLDGVYQIRGMGRDEFKFIDCKIMMCGSSPVGWTLMQKRYDGSVDFNKNWNEYKNGFGFEFKGNNAYRGPRPASVGEGWLGNDLINILTEGVDSRGVSLLIELERRFDKTPNNAVLGYERFSITNERLSYKLNHIEGFTSINGNAGNALLGDNFGKQGFGNDLDDTNHAGQKFSTKDRDNDNIKEFHCAEEDVSGWWFNACSAANLNGHYYSSGFVDQQTGRKPARGVKEYDDGILWNTWTHDKWESLMTTRMWLAPPGKLAQCEANLKTVEENDIIDTDDYSQDSSSSLTTDRPTTASWTTDAASDSDDRDYSSSSSFGSSRTDQNK